MPTYIRNSKIQRAKVVHAFPSVIDPAVTLIQWRFTVHERNTRSGRKSFKSDFRSIVTRPGRPGLWLDRPYYCYGGPHRYRRLPAGLALRLRVAMLRGQVARIASRISGCLDAVVRHAYWLARWPSAALERRRQRSSDPFAHICD